MERTVLGWLFCGLWTIASWFPTASLGQDKQADNPPGVKPPQSSGKTAGPKTQKATGPQAPPAASGKAPKIEPPNASNTLPVEDPFGKPIPEAPNPAPATTLGLLPVLPQAPAVAGQPVPIQRPAQAIIPAMPIRAVQGQALPMMQIGQAMPFREGRPFSLEDLALAKIDVGPKGPQLVALLEAFRNEEREIEMTVHVAEVRTRKAKLIDDETGEETEVDQQYTVMVPQTMKRTVNQMVSAGRKPVVFPLEKVSFFNIAGKPVEHAEATQKLEKMGPVFVLRRQVEIKEVDELMQRALKEECLIAVIPADGQ